MLYEEARVYLETISKYGSVLGLESIRELLDRLGNPQKNLRFVHVAGTNGKGSILAYCSTILSEAGYKVGRYISPTVMEYRERFQINGIYISEEELGELTEQVKNAVEQMEAEGMISPTVFEIETAIAFLYFAKQNCEMVVLETGLGGCLDATNIVEHVKVCVFASISRDHMGFLGDTLTEIAEKKAGIIKPGAVVVTVPQCSEVMEVLRKTAREKGCPFILAEPEKLGLINQTLDGQEFDYKEYRGLKIPLLGRYQLENVCTALEVIRVLKESGMKIPESSIRTGLASTVWPGRFQVIRREPLVIVDGAHNVDAVRRLIENIELYLKGKKIIAIMGVFKDKEYPVMVQMIAPYLDSVYTINLPNEERTLPKEVLKEEFEKYQVRTETADGYIDAMEKAGKGQTDDQVIVGFGSLSYLGEMIRYCGKGRKG